MVNIQKNLSQYNKANEILSLRFDYKILFLNYLLFVRVQDLITNEN